ncbi:MAG: tetratricopeptide repeat protein [Bryobacteraceae bacterium]
MLDLVLDIEPLQAAALVARKRNKLSDAEASLRKAIKILEAELSRHDLERYKDVSSAPEDIREAADRLADCYGSLAGILRRQGQVDEALQFYEKGKKLEEREEFLIKSTYNRVQWIVTSLQQRPPADGKLGADVASTIASVRELIGPSDDPWISADRALLAALDGDKKATIDVLDALGATKPIKDVYKSGLPVVQRLHKLLPGNAALAQAESWYAARAQ